MPNVLPSKSLNYFPASTGDCELGPSWLLWLCVVFGVLFLIMLCVNIFLCSAMTCSFSRSEIEVEPEEKAASVYTVQDYDPYRSWSGSQYGSRYSLDHPGTRPLSAAELTRPLGPEHPGTRVLAGPPSLTYTSLQNSRPGNNCQQCNNISCHEGAKHSVSVISLHTLANAEKNISGSRNGKYTGMGNGISNGGYNGYNGGPVYNGLSTGPRPAPAVYQPQTPRSRTPVRTPRARARARHRAREAGQFDLAPDQYSLHSRPASQTSSYRTAMRSRVSDM